MAVNKLISPEGNSFVANGVKYNIEGSLSMARYIEYLKLEIEFGYNAGYAGVYKEVTKAIGHLNKTNFVDSAVTLTRILEGQGNLQNKYIPAVNICGLFFNTDDEDRRVITDEMLDKKIKNWEKEGIEVGFFLKMASVLVRGYQKNYESSSQNTSREEKKETGSINHSLSKNEK